MKQKNNSKIIILLIAMLVMMVGSYFFDAIKYSDGEILMAGKVRAGIFDILPMIYSGFLYKLKDVMYILAVGGCYGVLANTKSYRKIVDKISHFIDGKELIVFPIIILLMGLYTSISYDILVLFFLVPFIISVILRNGWDRITAIATSFGGMLVGYIGQTLGSYGSIYLNQYLALEASSMIGLKLVIFLIAYALFTLFIVLHMKNVEENDDVEYDMYQPEILDESKVKKIHRVKVAPTVVIFVLCTIVMMLGYIEWNYSFNITWFSDMHNTVMNTAQITSDNVPIFGTLLGTYMMAFGQWNDYLYGIFIIVIVTIIVALMNKMSIEMFFRKFGIGAKKLLKFVVIYVLAFSIMYVFNLYPWGTGIVNNFLNPESFNIITLFIASVLGLLFCIDPTVSGSYFGSYLSTVYATETFGVMSIVWTLSSGIAMTIIPTSFFVMSMLSYLDVPYKDWLKYIWKFALSMTIISLVVIGIVFYM